MSNFFQDIKESIHESKKLKILEIVFLFGIAGIFLCFAFLFSTSNPLIFQGIVWLANVTMLVFIWYGVKLRSRKLNDIGLAFNWPGYVSALKIVGLSILVFIIAAVFFVQSGNIMARFVPATAPADLSGYNYLEGNLALFILVMLAVFIVSSVGEEVIYRGFLITRFRELFGVHKKWSTVISVILSAIIFGLIHFTWGSTGVVQTGFMGLVLGISYILTKKNLWINIWAHLYMDFFLMLQMYLGN